MKKEIEAAIKDIQNNPAFDYLVVIVDADTNSTTASTVLIQAILSDTDMPTLPIN